MKRRGLTECVCTVDLLSSACSRAGSLPQELPALGRGLCHHHLPHLRGPLLPDAHPGCHRGRLVARQVQVSGGEALGSKCLILARRFSGFNLRPSYLSEVMHLSLCPPTSVQDYCLPVRCLHRGTGGPGRQRHPRHHRCRPRWQTGQLGLPHVSRVQMNPMKRLPSHVQVWLSACAALPLQRALHGGPHPHRSGHRRHQALRGCLWRRPVPGASGLAAH